jgi:biotin carboxyl carrier protein
MDYHTRINAPHTAEGKVTVVETPTGYRVTVNGVTHEVTLTEPHAGALHVQLGPRSLDLAFTHLGDEVALTIDGHTHHLTVQDAARRALDHGGKVKGPQVIKAPMPGRIVAVLVKPDQPVERGQGLIVVEAMKMENELTAEAPGIVTAIHATPGQAVEQGTLLLTLAPPLEGAAAS